MEWLWQGVAVVVVGALVVGLLALIWRAARSAPAWIDTRRSRPRLEISCRVGRQPLLTGIVSTVGPDPLPAHAFKPVAGRMAGLAFIAVKNDADRPQADAVDVSARLFFYDESDRLRFDFPARWRDSLQVWQMRGDARSIIDRMAILAGSQRELDVAFQYDGADEAYGLNTEAQAYPNWCKPEWRLGPGTYHVRVRVAGRNVATSSADFDLAVSLEKTLEFRRR